MEFLKIHLLTDKVGWQSEVICPQISESVLPAIHSPTQANITIFWAIVDFLGSQWTYGSCCDHHSRGSEGSGQSPLWTGDATEMQWMECYRGRSGSSCLAIFERKNGKMNHLVFIRNPHGNRNRNVDCVVPVSGTVSGDNNGDEMPL